MNPAMRHASTLVGTVGGLLAVAPHTAATQADDYQARFYCENFSSSSIYTMGLSETAGSISGLALSNVIPSGAITVWTVPIFTREPMVSVATAKFSKGTQIGALGYASAQGWDIPLPACKRYLKSDAEVVPLKPPTIGDFLAERITIGRASEAFQDDDARQMAGDAAKDAIKLVKRANLGGSPSIIFSDDGVLTLQWQRGTIGTALLFAGDGTASVAFTRPGQLYAENGIEIGIQDDLPAQFEEVLAQILA